MSYSPFGAVLEATDAGGSEGLAAHRRRWNDKFVDDVSELAYYGARYYDRATMTWTQGDPLYRLVPEARAVAPRRGNLYVFSLNNPASYIDPDGRQAVEDEGAETPTPEMIETNENARRWEELGEPTNGEVNGESVVESTVGEADASGARTTHSASSTATCGPRNGEWRDLGNGVLEAYGREARNIADSIDSESGVRDGEITTLKDATDRAVKGDNLEAHELWQHANLKANGLATTRGSTQASKDNPVVILTQQAHARVTAAQNALGTARLGPFQNILANAEILRNVGAATETTISSLTDASVGHFMATLGIPGASGD